MLWNYYGQKRPPFAESAGPDQESVWDYPRPPRMVRDSRHISVSLDGLEIADTNRAIRVLETASAPGVYVPPEDVRMDRLHINTDRSYCEWKGEAEYLDLRVEQGVVRSVGWTYRKPTPQFAEITGYISFYPGRIECYIDGERVRPQPGRFYGGWVTSQVAGPIKGGPGTDLW